MAQKDFDKMLNDLYKGSVPTMKASDLDKLLQTESVVLLDTRQLDEFSVSHIPGALFAEYKKFDEDIIEKHPKDATIVVYCSVGYRSERIGEKLLDKGYKNVYNLYGGIFDWVNSGHEVVRDGIPTDSVHTYNKKWSKWLDRGIKVYD